jgi:hypothetical protein
VNIKLTNITPITDIRFTRHVVTCNAQCQGYGAKCFVKPATGYKQISLILTKKKRGKDRNRVTGINNGRKKKVR